MGDDRETDAQLAVDKSNWQPVASMAMQQKRAALLRHLRHYFDDHQVLEVFTPKLSAAATTDPNIQSLTADLVGQSARTHYLHTSPEFPMKRLLCAGSGDIYQICTVFRQGESGRYHNPEFQLLEWYRLDFDHHQLMGEVEALVCRVWQGLRTAAEKPLFQRRSYHEAILAATGYTVEQLDRQKIAAVLLQHSVDCPLGLADPLDSWLDLLMSTVIAPSFAAGQFTFLYDYPASQASLSRLRHDENTTVAERFELYFGELELANGFHELACADEQEQRFSRDLQLRQQHALEQVPMDQHLLQALRAGLPPCAGVAVGIDRLLMVLVGASRLSEVLAFPVGRA